MELLKNRIQEIIQDLKANSPYGPQSIEFLDPDKEIPFDGPTDTHAFYAYIKEEDQDAEINQVATGVGVNVVKSKFRLIANLAKQVEKEGMSKWLLWKLNQMAGVQTTNYSGQSERIYKEETGKDLQTWMPIIRIKFSVGTIATMSCFCEPDPCENSPCA